MKNAVIIAALLAISVGIIIFLVRARRRGEKCIGCPHAKQCRGGCSHKNK